MKRRAASWAKAGSSRTMPRKRAALETSRLRSSGRTSGKSKTAARTSGGATAARRKTGGTNRSREQASARATIDHQEIRKWAEERNATPATVKRTAWGKQEAGIIRLDFPGYSSRESLKPISWDEWFEVFESRGLALLHQDRTAAGKPSRFNKLVSRS